MVAATGSDTLSCRAKPLHHTVINFLAKPLYFMVQFQCMYCTIPHV